MQNGSRWDTSTTVKPLSLEAAQNAVERYIEGQDYGSFQVGEIMIFSNHAYAQIIEADTGIGAMEVLVDPLIPIYSRFYQADKSLRILTAEAALG